MPGLITAKSKSSMGGCRLSRPAAAAAGLRDGGLTVVIGVYRVSFAMRARFLPVAAGPAMHNRTLLCTVHKRSENTSSGQSKAA